MALVLTDRELSMPDVAAKSMFARVAAHAKSISKAAAKSPVLSFSAGLLLVILFASFVLPMVVHLPTAIYGNLVEANLPLGAHGHLLGTDSFGNDLFARTLYGGRISIEVGLGATAIGFIVGSAIGTTAGSLGGWVDSLFMRFIDVLMSVPSLILAMCVAALLGPSERDEIIAISFFTIPNYARLSRATTLKLREREFILVGGIMGASRLHTTLRHIYPNVFPGLITVAPLTAATAMIVEATLSFLGLGVRPPAPSWGNMIASGQQFMTTDPRLIIVPAVALLATVLCLNLFAEQLRASLSR